MNIFAHNGSIGFSFVSIDVRCIFVVHFDFRTSDFESSYLNKRCRSLRDFYQATLYLGQQKLCQKLASFSIPNTKYIYFLNGVVFLGHPVPYLTLPIDVLARTSGNNTTADDSILHIPSDLFCVLASSVFPQHVHECLRLTTLLFCAMCWFPQHQFWYWLIFLSNRVACKLESSLSDDIGNWW